eukprot:3357568-Amphidinium_carterae.1
MHFSLSQSLYQLPQQKWTTKLRSETKVVYRPFFYIVPANLLQVTRHFQITRRHNNMQHAPTPATTTTTTIMTTTTTTTTTTATNIAKLEERKSLDRNHERV